MKKLESVSYKNVKLTGGFWKKWQETVAMNTVNAVYEQFAASGRISAMTHTWREGEENRPHIFYDSDIAKWMEGAAYILQYAKNPELEDKVDAIVNLIEDGMSSEGYFNSYYQTIEPANRWTNRVNHELYCAGHLMEAAVAYYEVTGKRKFLDLMCRYADYIEEIFIQTEGAKFYTPGHEEIELALLKLYEYLGNKKHLELARFFIDQRGIGVDGHQQPQLTAAGIDAAEVRTQKGLAAGEQQVQHPGIPALFRQRQPLVGGPLPAEGGGVILPLMDIAHAAIQIAPGRQLEGTGEGHTHGPGSGKQVFTVDLIAVHGCSPPLNAFSRAMTAPSSGVQARA